jgi:hypothetical protein
MVKSENVNIRISLKDKQWLENQNISPTELFRDALGKAKRKAKKELKNRQNDVKQLDSQVPEITINQ